LTLLFLNTLLTVFTAPTCSSYQFRCGDGTCIDSSRKCDTRPDCPDRSDEANCGKCAQSPYL